MRVGAVAIAAALLAGCSLPPIADRLRESDQARAEWTVVVPDYGPGAVLRIDDRERGVTCYVTEYERGIDCLPTPDGAP